jgi:hypothetical protein
LLSIQSLISLLSPFAPSSLNLGVIENLPPAT